MGKSYSKNISSSFPESSKKYKIRVTRLLIDGVYIGIVNESQALIVGNKYYYFKKIKSTPDFIIYTFKNKRKYIKLALHKHSIGIYSFKYITKHSPPYITTHLPAVLVQVLEGKTNKLIISEYMNPLVIKQYLPIHMKGSEELDEINVFVNGVY